MRVDWLCQCGNGRLAVPESHVPDYCPTCGHPIGAEPEYDTATPDTDLGRVLRALEIDMICVGAEMLRKERS